MVVLRSFMRRHILKVAGMTLLVAQSVSAANADITVPGLAALDAAQKTMVAKADVPALAALAHPDLKINAPTNRVLNRDQFVSMMKSGKIGAEAFDRTHLNAGTPTFIFSNRESGDGLRDMRMSSQSSPQLHG